MKFARCSEASNSWQLLPSLVFQRQKERTVLPEPRKSCSYGRGAISQGENSLTCFSPYAPLSYYCYFPLAEPHAKIEDCVDDTLHKVSHLLGHRAVQRKVKNGSILQMENNHHNYQVLLLLLPKFFKSALSMLTITICVHVLLIFHFVCYNGLFIIQLSITYVSNSSFIFHAIARMI